jgi:UDP-glucose-4-epimerase GalE
MTSVVLVPGGAGYIGSHTCKALSRAGFLPVAFDNLCTGHREFAKWGPLVVGDVRDKDAVAHAMREHDASAVIHFAALSYVGDSVTDPAAYYSNNVVGMLSLLAAMRDVGVDKIVFSSTCATYGEPGDRPIREDLPQRPISPYGRTKLHCEHILGDFDIAYGIRSVCLRYFNAAGADPDGEIGELRDPEPHLIPRALMSLQGHLSDFAVFGGDYPTPDGTAVRDYIHVSDLADAHVAALRRLFAGGASRAYNLGTGHGYSVGQVLSEIERVTSRTLSRPVGVRRPGDSAFLVADASLAADDLGFVPRRSDLESIVATAWTWHQKAHPSDFSTAGQVSGAG